MIKLKCLNFVRIPIILNFIYKTEHLLKYIHTAIPEEHYKLFLLVLEVDNMMMTRKTRKMLERKDAAVRGRMQLEIIFNKAILSSIEAATSVWRG